MERETQFILDILENSVPARDVVNAIYFLKQGLTPPFILRYRKGKIGDKIDSRNLREIQESLQSYELLQKKISKVVKAIGNKASPYYIEQIKNCNSLEDLDLLYQPFKEGGKGNLADRAKNLGLADAANNILNGEICNLGSFVNPQVEGLKNILDVKKGIQHIIADIISHKKEIMDNLLNNIHSVSVETKKTKTAETLDASQKYKEYYAISKMVNSLKEHQILAINRAEKGLIITVKLKIKDGPRKHFIHELKCIYNKKKNAIIDDAIEDCFKRLIEKRFFRRIRTKIFNRAEVKSIYIFGENIKKILLVAPVKQRLLAIDPGWVNGCKIAVLEKNGSILSTAVIFPHTKRRKEAEKSLIDLAKRHQISLFVIGNGTACRDTETFISELLKTNQLNGHYTIVDESGSSVYSVSNTAEKEFGDLDPKLISAVSIGRRLQDPLLEICKLDAKTIGVGMYQHDVDQKKLNGMLEYSISSAVNLVGVDINSCNIHILKRISGLSQKQAESIIAYREKNGGIYNREEVLGIKGIGQVAYQNCCGFLRVIPDTLNRLENIEDESEVDEENETNTAKSRKRKLNMTKKNAPTKKKIKRCLNPFDRTSIHPESYIIAQKLLQYLKLTPDLIGSKKIAEVTRKLNPKELCTQFGTDEHTMTLILDGLYQSEESIRQDFVKPVFRSGILSTKDLKIGTVLDGVVRNVTTFGAFVDIGVGKNGLLHISKFQGRTFGPGDKVRCKINSLENERIGLMLEQ